MTTHVRMGATHRQYEMVKDTRMGRTILAATSDRNHMGQVVTDYIADKMLERDRLIEGEWIAMSGYNFDGDVQSREEETIKVRQTRPMAGVFVVCTGFCF